MLIEKPKILIVDDVPEQLEAFSRLLKRLDVELICTSNGHDAINQTLQHEFALTILDIHMPKMDGYQLASLLRNEERTRNIPIIFVTGAYHDEQYLLKGYEHGAIDYIEKPFHSAVLQSKVNSFLDIWTQKKELEQTIASLTKKKEMLEHEVDLREKANDVVMQLATHDPLTNLPNRIILKEQLDKAIASAKRHKHKLAVLFIDLDGFKPVNDQYSHEAGDFVLKEVATRLRKSTRDEDTVIRLGGDEFIILLPNIESKAEGSDLAERIKITISCPINWDKVEIRITASIGLALFPENGTEAEDLIKQSDAAMYVVKNSGKNGVGFEF